MSRITPRAEDEWEAPMGVMGAIPCLFRRPPDAFQQRRVAEVAVCPDARLKGER